MKSTSGTLRATTDFAITASPLRGAVDALSFQGCVHVTLTAEAIDRLLSKTIAIVSSHRANTTEIALMFSLLGTDSTFGPMMLPYWHLSMTNDTLRGRVMKRLLKLLRS